jgi:hypothetical protein
MRCSALPLVAKCPGSYHLTEGYGSAVSRLGTAFHEAARAKVIGVPCDMESLALRYGLSDEEVASINYGIYNIQIAIPQGAKVFADDKQLTGLSGKLKGTPDFVVYVPESLTVVDWKSGWAEVEGPETNAQLIGYGLLILEELENQKLKIPSTIHFVIVQPKINKTKAYSCTLEQLLKFKEDIISIIDNAENGLNKFVTGPWCNSCFKCMNCPAFAHQVRSLVNFVYPLDDINATRSVEESLRLALPFAKAALTMSRKITDLAKAWVDNNGPLDLGSGQLYAKVVDVNKELKIKETYKVLQEYFSEAEIWDLLSISMSKITELARKTKRGLSTVVSNSLVEAGALTQETVVSYRIIKQGGGNHGATTKQPRKRLTISKKD